MAKIKVVAILVAVVMALSLAVPAFSTEKAEPKKDEIRVGDPWAVLLGGVALIGIGAAVFAGGYSSHPAIASQADLGPVSVSMGDVLRGYGGAIGVAGLAIIGVAVYKAFLASPSPDDDQNK